MKKDYKPVRFLQMKKNIRRLEHPPKSSDLNSVHVLNKSPPKNKDDLKHMAEETWQVFLPR